MLTLDSISDLELDEVCTFLRGIFSAPPDHPPFRADVLRWKAIAPHPFWSGSRSYVYRNGGQIEAHGCVTPIEWLYAGGQTRTACVVDWAAGRTTPGIGMLLYREVAKMLDGVTAIGGSEAARRVLPRAGFKPIVEMPVFARVVRPLARHMQRPKDWKTPARLARDVARALPPLPDPGPDWRAERVARFDDAIQPALPEPDRPSPVVSRRSVELLNYWLDCPAAVMEGYRVSGPSGLNGYFVFSKLGAECRIVDLGINGVDWTVLCALAVRTAAADRNIHIVKIAASATAIKDSFTALRFHVERIEPVLYWDSSKKSPPPGEPHMTFAENDFFYLP
jgi:hypothetical protein